jgi:hypothetical protein
MRTHSATTLSTVAIAAFAVGILTARVHFSTPAVAAMTAQARFENVLPLGMAAQVAVFLDRSTGDIWYYDLDKPGSSGYAGTLQELGKPLSRRTGVSATGAPYEGAADRAYVAAMKSDLRNLVTAEEAYFADSVKYTDRFAALNLHLTTGNRLIALRLSGDGWVAQIGNANTRTVCTIFIGKTSAPPATREGEPTCQ